MAGDHEKLVQEYQQMNKKAFVVGYTGAIGSELVKALLESRIFAKVVLIGRRSVTYEDELYKDVEQRVVDFENLDAHADAFKSFDVGYCCLGTARERSSSAEYYRINHDYVVSCAQLAKSGGCSQYHLVSAGGANKDSLLMPVRAKGESEEEVKAMDFESVFIYRPPLVITERQQRRVSETVMRMLLWPITFFSPTFHNIPVATLAKAILNKTLTPATEKVEILENKDLHHAGAS